METMINKDKKISFNNRALVFLKNNSKIIISVILSFLLIFILYQYYFLQKKQKPLELSKIYDQVNANFDSVDFEEKMNLVAKENGIFGILASLEIINKSLGNNDYSYAYIQYIKLLKSNKSKIIYNSIIALHGAYNLIEYVSEEDISNLLSYVDESKVSFIGYKYEIEYLLSIITNDFDKRKKLFNKILNNENIHGNIKERVKKINEFEKYQ